METSNLKRADYWKSNERKFCDFCKCWIADNKPSVAFHESGRRHKANVAKRISEISKKSAKDEKNQQKMDQELRKMEEAAMAAYAKDISRNADMTSQRINATLEAAKDNVEIGPSLPTTAAGPSKKIGPSKPVDPIALPMDPEELAAIEARKKAALNKDVDTSNPSLWCEAVSDEGYTYYWNVKTNESVWTAPKEGYLSLDEYDKISKQAADLQEMQAQKERSNFLNNAEEIAAKFKREKLKERRVQDVEKPAEFVENTEIGTDGAIYTAPAESSSSSYSSSAPYGQWQTVVKKEVPVVDLQLPESNYAYIPPPVVKTEPEPPVKQFKEKVAKLDEETAASEPGVFKKRKIFNANKKNARQRLDDD